MQDARHQENTVDNPAVRRWLQDDHDMRNLLGYSINAWLTLSPATAKVLGVPVDGVGNRGLAITNGLGYYDQKLIQIYLSAGLQYAEFVRRKLRDFLTEIALLPRVLINFIKPRRDTTIRERIYGIPSFSINIDTSQDIEFISARLWRHTFILNASDHWFIENRFLTVRLTLEPKFFPDDGSWVRAKTIRIPDLTFATFVFSKNNFGLSYSYLSDFIDEGIALRFLGLDAKFAARKDDGRIRSNRMPYPSGIEYYRRRG